GAWSNGSCGSVQSETAQPFRMLRTVLSPLAMVGWSGVGSSLGSPPPQKRQVRTDSGAVSQVAFLLPGYSTQKPVSAVWLWLGLLQPLPPVGRTTFGPAPKLSRMMMPAAGAAVGRTGVVSQLVAPPPPPPLPPAANADPLAPRTTAPRHSATDA